MSLIVQKVGSVRLNDELLGAVVYQIRLFKNDHTPTVNDVLGDYTEADFDGYGPQNIVWNSSIIVSNRAKALGNLVQWTHTGGPVNNDIYGYFVVEMFVGEL